jgi:hypothetical protein
MGIIILDEFNKLFEKIGYEVKGEFGIKGHRFSKKAVIIEHITFMPLRKGIRKFRGILSFGIL